jgi:hypothetical protein
MSRKTTYGREHRLMGHQPSRIEPADQLAEMELILQPSNALDAMPWCTDDGNILTHLLKGQAVQTCLYLFIALPCDWVHIHVDRDHAPAKDLEVVHDALARYCLDLDLGFRHIDGKEQSDLLSCARLSGLLKRLPLDGNILLVITQPGSNKEPMGERAFWMA